MGATQRHPKGPKFGGGGMGGHGRDPRVQNGTPIWGGEKMGGHRSSLKVHKGTPNLEGGGWEDMGATQGCRMGPEFGGGGETGGIGAA